MSYCGNLGAFVWRKFFPSFYWADNEARILLIEDKITKIRILGLGKPRRWAMFRIECPA